MVKINLSQGKKTIIDDIDQDLCNYKWYFSNQRNRGYAAHRDVGGMIYIHRIILERILDRKLLKGEYVDHINRNELDNRRSNLRLSTNSQNHANRGLDKSNTTGYRGVVKVKSGNWVAHIWCKNKLFVLGTFTSIIDAAKAYDKKAKELFGEFAFQNLGNK